MQSPCRLDVDFTSGAVLTDPIDTDEDGGELTIKSKLSSVELMEVLLMWTLSIESMLLLMEEQQLSSMVEECVRVCPVLEYDPTAPLINRFTSRSGLSIDVDERTESFSTLLVEGNLVCLGFGVVGGTVGIIAADRAGGSCVCGCCCCCCGGCGGGEGTGS